MCDGTCVRPVGVVNCERSDPLGAGVTYLGGGSTDVLSFIPPPGSDVQPPLTTEKYGAAEWWLLLDLEQAE